MHPPYAGPTVTHIVHNILLLSPAPVIRWQRCCVAVHFCTRVPPSEGSRRLASLIAHGLHDIIDLQDHSADLHTSRGSQKPKVSLLLTLNITADKRGQGDSGTRQGIPCTLAVRASRVRRPTRPRSANQIALPVAMNRDRETGKPHVRRHCCATLRGHAAPPMPPGLHDPL